MERSAANAAQHRRRGRAPNAATAKRLAASRLRSSACQRTDARALPREDDELGVAAGLAAEALVRYHQRGAGYQQLTDPIDASVGIWMRVERLGCRRRRPGVGDRPGLGWLLALRLLVLVGSAPGWRGFEGTVIRFQRMPAPSSVTSMAVKTWVPSGRSGFSITIGMSNIGMKPCRTNIFFSLRLTNTAT